MSWIRIMVQSIACSAANPTTSQGPDRGLDAVAVSKAASRRRLGLRRARDAEGKIEVVDMVMWVARFRRVWNQLAVNARRATRP